MEGSAGGELGGGGGHDVAAVEGVAGDGGGAPDEFVGVGAGVRVPGPGDQAVVGTDDELGVDFGDEDAAGGTDAGVDDGDMDGAGGEGSNGAFEEEGAGENGVARDVVGDVDDADVGDAGEEDGLHGGDVVVGEAEVGCKGDYGSGHVGRVKLFMGRGQFLSRAIRHSSGVGVEYGA